MLVVAVAGVRAVADDWQPVGDDAFLALRARDVFSDRPPLLSTASSGGASSGVAYQHPGPAFLYLLSPFAEVGGGRGVALGTAVLNGAWIVAMASLLRRRGRPAVAGAALAALSGVVWAMGSAVLVDPWNPHAATLPLALLGVSAWAAWLGSGPALAWGVLGGSVAAQTHLSFGPPALVGLVLLVAGALVSSRREGASRRGLRRWGLVAGAVGLVSVLPPVIEQLANGSDGNMARILRGGDFAEATVGAGDAVGVLADRLVLPPWHLRGSWLGPLFGIDLPGPATSVVLLGVLAVVVGVAVVLARRRADREVVVAAGIGAALAVAGGVAAAWFPLRLGLPVPYFRWLWPAAGLLHAAWLARPPEWAAIRIGARRPGFVVGVGWAIVTAAIAVAGLPAAGEDAAASPPDQQEIARGLLGEAAPALEDLGAVYVAASGQEIALWFLPALIDDLDRRGVEVRVDDPVLVQQSGSSRRSSGDEEWAVVARNPVGRSEVPPPSWRRIASHRPLSEAEHARLEADTAEAVARLRAGSVDLTSRGRAVAGPAELDLWLDIARENPRAFVRSRNLVVFLDEGLLEFTGVEESFLRDVAERASVEDDRTVDLWLVPRDETEALR